MYYCISYDITSDKTRLRLVKMCKRAGLVRLQKSVFTGRSDPARIAEIEQQARSMLLQTDRLCIIPLDQSLWESLVLLGKHDPKSLMARRMPVRFF